MAIKKQKTLRTGVVGEYWKITKISYDPLIHSLSCVLSLFVNEARSDEGCSPLNFHKNFIFKITSEEASGDLRALGYEMIKNKCATLITPHVGSLDLTPYVYDNDIANGEDIIE